VSDHSLPWSETRGISLTRMFLAFTFIGLSGFGGVLPLARHELVERRRWISAAEFTDILSLCNFLPGPNVVNMTVTFGVRVAGVRGAVVAFVGLMVMPVAIVLALATIYAEFSDVPQVRDAFRGIASAAAGLIVAMAAKMAWGIATIPRAVIMTVVVFAAIIVLRLPLILIIAIFAPLSIALAWWIQDE
jgi:chromate transporter